MARPFLAPAALLLVACNAGMIAPPTAATPAGSSRIEASIKGADVGAVGRAFVRVDPSREVFTVTVFQADTKPEPSCASLATLDRALQKGGFIALGGEKLGAGPGTYPIVSLRYAKSDAKSGAVVTGEEKGEASFEVEKNDGKTIEGRVTATASAPASKANGKVVATVCGGS
jgi:hypothetical protein